MTMTPDKLTALRKPFTPGQIGKLPKVTCKECSDPKKTCSNHQRRKCRTCGAYISTQHIHIDFVGHAHVTERLLDVDPEWSWEPVHFSANGLPALDDAGGLWIRLTIGGVTRFGYGHEGGGGIRGGDGMKATISDAIKNGAMRFGVALDLWKKEPLAPVAEGPVRPVEQPTMTAQDRANELRGQIKAMAERAPRRWDIAALAADFTEWSQGKDITKATPAVLIEYKTYLERAE